MTRKTLYLAGMDWDQLETMAAQEQRSLSNYIKMIITAHIDKSIRRLASKGAKAPKPRTRRST